MAIVERRHFPCFFYLLMMFALVVPAAGAYAEGSDAALESASEGGGDFSSSELVVRRRTTNATNFGPRFRFSLSGAVGYSTTTGEWFDGLTHGPFANGVVRAAVANNVYLGAGYRYQLLDADQDLQGYIFLCDEFDNCAEGLAEWDIALSEYLFLVGFMSNPTSDTTPIAYFELGFGALYHDIEFRFYDQSSTVPEVSKTKETKFAFQTAIGAIFPLGPQIGLDFQGNMRITGDTGGTDFDGTTYSSSTGYLFGASLGVVLMFGG